MPLNCPFEGAGDRGTYFENILCINGKSLLTPYYKGLVALKICIYGQGVPKS